jgi:hypothetical protein
MITVKIGFGSALSKVSQCDPGEQLFLMAVLVLAGVAEGRQEGVLPRAHPRRPGRLLMVVGEEVEKTVGQEVGNLAGHGPAGGGRLALRDRQADDHLTQGGRLIGRAHERLALPGAEGEDIRLRVAAAVEAVQVAHGGGAREDDLNLDAGIEPFGTEDVSGDPAHLAGPDAAATAGEDPYMDAPGDHWSYLVVKSEAEPEKTDAASRARSRRGEGTIPKKRTPATATPRAATRV